MPKFTPLSQPKRISKIDIDDLNQVLEGNRAVSNGLPKSTSLPLHAMQQQLYGPERGVSSDRMNARYSEDMQDPIQPLQVAPVGQHNHLPSSTSHTPDSSGLFVGKSPQPDKAKQVMGLNPSKPLNYNSTRKIPEDGNIAALEKEYADVFSPRLPPTNSGAREDGESMEEDRIKETARDIYNGTELLVAFGDAARWLMSSNDFNCKVRTAYMELFDFMGLDILTAVRLISLIRI